MSYIYCTRYEKQVDYYKHGCFQVFDASGCKFFVEHPDYINRDHSHCLFIIKGD